MKVFLAGYNVDAETIRKLKGNTLHDSVTPETLPAAYARISRDARPVNELRREAREDMERTRKSNRTIIFKMGHHSVAEHAVFNFDIIGISRLAMEEVEKFRLCSYTEKSQRYIALENKFVVPEEIKGTHFERRFIDLMNEQGKAYSYFVKELKKYVFDKYKDLANDPKKHNFLEGKAKEDARYITALAVESQAGQTINARNLELLLCRFASHHLEEVRSLGRKIYDEVVKVAPSVILPYQDNSHSRNLYVKLKRTAGDIIASDFVDSNFSGSEVGLVEFTRDGDDIVCASLLHTLGSLPYEECRKVAKDMPLGKKREVFKAVWRNMQAYDSLPREFEYVNLTFSVVISAACFGQLKRHRMAAITVQDYEPDLGNTIPESIDNIGGKKRFLKVISGTNDLYRDIKKEIPYAAPYVLTNSHRRRVLIRVNARELYHISRMREDNHAQWDIRSIVSRMTSEAKKVMPLTFELVGGKDKYNYIYKNIFGELPKAAE